jgi:hypothetical protein
MKLFTADGLVHDLILSHKIEMQATVTAADVRDMIRVKFDMVHLGTQIETLQVMPSLINVMTEEWSVVQQALWQDKNQELGVSMTPCRTEAGEGIWRNPLPWSGHDFPEHARRYIDALAAERQGGNGD